MRSKATLEPQIIRYILSGNNNLDELITFLNEKTGVSREKIFYRIKKMADQRKISTDGNEIILCKDTVEKLDERCDDFTTIGPVSIGRKGRFTFIRSDLSAKDLEESMKRIETEFPLIKDEINSHLAKIENMLLNDFDPLDTLAYVTCKNLLTDPEKYSESTHKGKQLLVEIAQNLVLKHSLEEFKVNGDPNDIPMVNDFLEEFYPKMSWGLIYEVLLRKGLTTVEKDILFNVTNFFLLVRGYAYAQHYEEVSIELFSQLNDVLMRRGFSIQNYWSTVHELENQINSNYTVPLITLQQEQKRFLEFANNKTNSSFDRQQITTLFRTELYRDRAENVEKLKKLSEVGLKQSFQIALNNNINQPLMNLVSLHFGDNKEWRYPLDKTEIALKPIIKVGENYYSFLTGHLIRNVIQIVESLISEEEKTKRRYSDIKGKYFEDKAITLIAKASCGKPYPSLIYPKLILFEDVAFLVEVKGKKKRIIAGVEDVLKVTKEDFIAHIDNAFEQTKRALAYIMSKDQADFKDKTGKTVLTIESKKIKRFYLINVCLEDFSKLAIDLNLAKSWDPNLIKGEQYPWVVNIYDLMVISDLLSKNHFIHYLDDRIKLAMSDDLQSVDELDLLGYFLKNGNLKIEKGIDGAKAVFVQGYSEDIDRWYSHLRGEVEHATKPSID